MEDLFAGAMIGVVILLLLIIPILIVYIIGLWKLYNKAGRKGWEAIIPFYNTWVLAEISGVAWWYPLIIIADNIEVFSNIYTLHVILNLASIVSTFFITYNLSKKFHKGVGFAALTAFLPMIMIPILGFSNKYQYDSNVSVNENGPIGDNKNSDYQNNTSTYTETSSNNNDYSQAQYCQFCGNPINAEAKFCGNCGNEIKK